MGRRTPYLALALIGIATLAIGPNAGARAKALTPPTVMHIYGATLTLPASLNALHAGDGLAADSVGNIYVGYQRANFFAYIAVLDAKGQLVRDWQVDQRLAGIRVPKVAVGGPDNLVYVAPTADPEQIKVYTRDGTFVRQFGAGSKIGTGIGDIEVDSSGNVYVSSAAVTGQPNRFVVRFDAAGNVTRTWVPQPGGRSNAGGGIAVAPDGSIYEVGLPTVSGGSTLTHLAANGPVLSTKDLDKVLGKGEYKDVDYVSGHLYLSGNYSTAAGISHHHALAVLAANETVQDQILGEGNQVAVSGTHVWVTGLTTSTSTPQAAAVMVSIGGMDEVPLHFTSRLGKWASSSGGKGCGGASSTLYNAVPQVLVGTNTPTTCKTMFVDDGTPCERPGTRGVPVQAYLGGRVVGIPTRVEDLNEAFVQVPASQLQTGPLIFSWSCRDAANQEVEHYYEWKANVTRLGDPSGTVLDARTGRALPSATVRIEFSATPAGPWGAPLPLTTLPEIDREVTPDTGRFAWDVADGYWRLQASAVGYYPLTSKVYKVPPEVTGIRLELRPDPAQQRLLIDPGGRVGKLRLGMRASSKLHVAGLRIRVVRGHITSIVVRSKRYQTVAGIKLGSKRQDFERAYPDQALKVLQKAKKGVPKTFRVKKATFTVKGTVTAIKLGR